MNEIHVSFNGRREVKGPEVWQYDYGRVIVFDDLELPAAYQVQFANAPEGGEAIQQIGTEDGVTLPDMYLTNDQDVYAWIYLHEGENDGETRYMVRLPKRARPAISEAEPTPEQQDVITETIAAALAAVEDAEAARDAAQAAAGDFQGITAEAETTDPDTGATIEVTHSEGGLYHFAFGIPHGEKGDPGDDATDEQVMTAVDAWLDENITNPSNPPLDTSLSLSNAAAPANLVGELKSAIQQTTIEDTLLRDDLPGTTTTVTMDSNGNPTSIVHSADGTTVRTDAFVWSTDSVTETRTSGNKYITITTNLTTLAQTISAVQEVA